jgi:hypothetical protein
MNEVRYYIFTTIGGFAATRSIKSKINDSMLTA